MTSLFSQIKQAYLGRADKHALIIGERHYTFEQLKNKVEDACVHFAQLGISPGDKVILVLPNELEFIIAMLALAELNACLVPLPLGINAKAFAKACDNTSAKHVIAWHASLNSYKTIADNNKLSISNWVSVGKSLEWAHNFEASNDGRIKSPPTIASLDMDAPYILTMTSGSTGAPKPITLSQQTKVKRAHSAISLYEVTSQDITLIATPLYHSLAERLIFVSLLSGGTAVLMPKFTIKQWLAQIAEHKVSFTIAVSSQLKQILACDPIPDMSSLRCVVSSSALLDMTIKEALLKVLDCDFHECYGASEIAIATSIKFDPNSPIQSVGKAIPDTALILLSDDKKPVAIGEIGEIACKTPMRFSGYYQQTETTQNALFQDYFCTGDLGKLDKEGNLYFVGRKKEIIITGGINIYPSDIEAVLKAQPQVDNAVAFALKDDNLGEVVAVALTTSVPSDEIAGAVQKLRIACATELDAQQQPHKYFVFEQLPQNAMGKINKIAITSTAEAHKRADKWLYHMEQN